MKLTLSERLRIEQQLNRRQTASGDPNFVGVAFGAATKRGIVDQQRGFVACYLVRRKLKRPRSAYRIAETVSVRIKRRNRFVCLTFRTDVEETAGIVPTGIRVEKKSKWKVTSGVLIRWSLSAGTNVHKWGIITVLHQVGKNTMVSVELRNGMRFETCAVHRRARSGLDAAVVLVTEQQALLIKKQAKEAGQRVAEENGPGLKVRTLIRIAKDPETKSSGRSHPVSGSPRDFTIQRFAFGPLVISRKIKFARKHIIFAKSPSSGVFKGGTSGCMWDIVGQPAGMQFAGKKASFRLGYGQVLKTIGLWAKTAVGGKRFRIEATL